MNPNKHEKDSILHEKCVKTTKKKEKQSYLWDIKKKQIRGSKIKSIINLFSALNTIIISSKHLNTITQRLLCFYTAFQCPGGEAKLYVRPWAPLRWRISRVTGYGANVEGYIKKKLKKVVYISTWEKSKKVNKHRVLLSSRLISSVKGLLEKHGAVKS